jgi:hypothetical protein
MFRRFKLSLHISMLDPHACMKVFTRSLWKLSEMLGHAVSGGSVMKKRSHENFSKMARGARRLIKPDDPSFRASLRWRGIRRFEIRAARRNSRLPVLFISHTLLGEFSIRVVRYVAQLAERRAKLQAQAQ